MFLLLEDEFGTINLIVPPDLYEVNRLTVRSEPLLLCEGRLEKLPQAGGGINVFVKAVRPLVAPEEQAAEVVALAEKRVAAAATGRGEGAQGGREAAVDDGGVPSGLTADPELCVGAAAIERSGPHRTDLSIGDAGLGPRRQRFCIAARVVGHTRPRGVCSSPWRPSRG